MKKIPLLFLNCCLVCLPPLNAASKLKHVDHPKVDEYIRRFSSPKQISLINDSLKRAKPFLPFIMERIDHYKLPRELIFLPIIESAYKASAVSHVGAAGVWQFMRGSAAPYGLAMDEWRDDRLDIYLSTDAALRKLRDEWKLTGDIYMAIAAYNGGLGRILRAKAKCKELKLKNSFWTMLDHKMLPRETMYYVPKLLAVSHIVRNSKKYGAVPVKWPKKHQKTPYYTTLRANGQISLEALAAKAGVPHGELKLANAGLKYGITPPGHAKTYHIKAPAAYAPLLAAALEDESGLLQEFKVYTVKKGDALSVIAYNYGVSQRAIVGMNPGLSPSRIYPGQRLVLPIPGVAAKSVMASAEAGFYTVRRGDSLWSISLRYGTTAAMLAKHNKLDEKKPLTEGMKLEVPL